MITKVVFQIKELLHHKYVFKNTLTPTQVWNKEVLVQ